MGHRRGISTPEDPPVTFLVPFTAQSGVGETARGPGGSLRVDGECRGGIGVSDSGTGRGGTLRLNRDPVRPHRGPVSLLSEKEVLDDSPSLPPRGTPCGPKTRSSPPESLKRTPSRIPSSVRSRRTRSLRPRSVGLWFPARGRGSGVEERVWDRDGDGTGMGVPWVLGERSGKTGHGATDTGLGGPTGDVSQVEPGLLTGRKTVTRPGRPVALGGTVFGQHFLVFDPPQTDPASSDSILDAVRICGLGESGRTVHCRRFYPRTRDDTGGDDKWPDEQAGGPWYRVRVTYTPVPIHPVPAAPRSPTLRD